jgi:3'(2'), 5'-bisphosphate nucleotidase
LDATSPRLLDAVTAIALTAGKAILAVARGRADVTTKSDGSPVTAADQASHDAIVGPLAAILPGVPVISEEAAAHAAVAAGTRFWLVDPLDGTKEFIKQSGEYTVNIALIDGGRPVLGVVHAPALDLTFRGDMSGAERLRDSGSAVEPIVTREAPAEGVTVVASRDHGDTSKLSAFLEGRKVAAERGIGSSLKFCLVAAGEADLYPRFGRTMEWDTAAGHAVVLAAGGAVRTEEGADLTYGKPGYENPHFVVYARI